MRKKFNSITELLNSDFLSGLAAETTPPRTDRTLKSTRLEREIFRDLLTGSPDMRSLRDSGREQLSTFDGLSHDVFTAFYSLVLRREDEQNLSEKALRINRSIVEDLLKDEAFTAVKSVCEGRELPAFDAAEEFCERILEKLPELQKDIGGENDLPNVVESLREQADQIRRDLQSILQSPDPQPLEKQALRLANRLDSKQKQIEDLSAMLADRLLRADSQIKAAVASAAESAGEKAMETVNLLTAWGDGSGEMGSTPVNRELLRKVRANPALAEVGKILGRYRDVICQKRRNSFSYGLGEKYDVTTGSNINLCLASELALLASPETQTLFLRKFQLHSLKQYRKRERTVKGAGDVIVCLDESGSMKDVLAWGKALALALLDIAARDKRKFALVHFSAAKDIKTDLFLPGEYSGEDIFNAAEHNFNGGGTDFETPLREALLLTENGFENADIVFITDGECAVSDDFTKTFHDAKAARRLEVTGVLMDKNVPGSGASLIPFCDRIFRSSELSGDEIAESVFSQKI